MERIRRTTVDPAPIETQHSSYDDGPEESASHTIGQQGRNATDPRRPDQTFINSLMTGGMTAIQGCMTSLQEQEIKRELEHYKKKAERLEKKYGKRKASRASTPGIGGSSHGSDSDGSGTSYLFDSGGPSEPNTEELDILDKYKNRLEGAKGPKMKIPETFTGDRTDTTRFIQQCRVYFVTKSKEFNTELEKMLWITSLCHGEAVEGWVDWITSMLNEKNPKAPKKASEMLAFLNAYFGDPDEVSTARHKLDQLKQTGRMEDYVVAFQSVAYKTKYTEGELEHRFVVGLKPEIRNKCLAAYPRPMGLVEWITRGYALQHAYDLNVGYSRAEGQSNSYRGRVPGRLHPRTQTNYSTRQLNNP
jgi:hypothetical protein